MEMVTAQVEQRALVAAMVAIEEELGQVEWVGVVTQEAGGVHQSHCTQCHHRLSQAPSQADPAQEPLVCCKLRTQTSTHNLGSKRWLASVCIDAAFGKPKATILWLRDDRVVAIRQSGCRADVGYCAYESASAVRQ
jgi:hypothetical protein